MALIVQKYGGTSLASPKLIRRAARSIRESRGQDHQLVVVVSAMGRMTNHLIALAERTVARPPQREMDMLLTAGERVSMSLLAMTLQELDIPSISFTGSQVGILTTSVHSEARILEIRAHRVQQALEQGKVVIIAGFQGVSREKEVTTLGRGGSDTSAVALAAHLKADRCEIMTDVSGLLTADPRRVTEAKILDHCDYDVALEYASLGAKMHPRSLSLAKRYAVNLIIRSSDPLQPGFTQIGNFERNPTMEQTKITGIASQSGFSFFRAQTSIDHLIEPLKEHNCSPKFVSIVDSHTSFLCSETKAGAVEQCLRDKGIPFSVNKEIGTVSVVGDGVGECSDVLPAMIESAKALDTKVWQVSQSSLSVTIAVEQSSVTKLAAKLHERFI